MAERQKLRDPLTAMDPRRLASGTGSPAGGNQRIPVVAFVRDPSLIRWIELEFRHLDAVLRITYSHIDMEECLLRDPPPRPPMLLVSIDELTTDELCAIKRVRNAGWRGRTIALSRSRMLPALRSALGIDRLLTPPFVQDLFVDILRELRAQDRRDAAEGDDSYGVVAGREGREGSAAHDGRTERAGRPDHSGRVDRAPQAGDDGDDATSRITTGSSSRYTARPAASLADSMLNPSFVSSEVSSAIRTNRR